MVVSKHAALLLLTQGLPIIHGLIAPPAYPPCASGLTCANVFSSIKVAGKELVFDCAFVQQKSPKGFVYFMHGNDGALSKGMWFDIMQQLGALNYSSLSCDARGYSPGASPDLYDAYNYDELAGDLFGIVDATGLADQFGGKFHLVSHDQGARVAWHSIAKFAGRQRFLSFTSLSIPHSDVFSDALYGNDTYPAQVVASQYVRMLVLPNSTTVQQDTIFNRVCKNEGWSTPNVCQRTLWWYNGAIDAGAMALGPWNASAPYGNVAQYVGITKDNVEKLTQYPMAGVPQTTKVGRVDEFPVLYACGTDDTSDLCDPYFDERSRALISDYTYLKVDHCGHQCVACPGIIPAVIANIQKAAAGKKEQGEHVV